MKHDPVGAAVEADRNGKTQCRQVLIKRPVQRGAEFEAEFRPHEIDHIAVEWSTGRLNEAPSILRKVDYAMRFIHEDAGRGKPLDGAAMGYGFVECRSPRRRFDGWRTRLSYGKCT